MYTISELQAVIDTVFLLYLKAKNKALAKKDLTSLISGTGISIRKKWITAIISGTGVAQIEAESLRIALNNLLSQLAKEAKESPDIYIIPDNAVFKIA